MKDHTDTLPRSGATQITPRGLLQQRVTACLTGADLDHLATSPDIERRAVTTIALALVLSLSCMALGWWVALGIARGHFGIAHLPFALLAGIAVFVVDRAILRQHWVRHGQRALRARDFAIPDEDSGRLGAAVQWILRVTISMILSFTTAGFLELGLFERDITAWLHEESQAANQVIVTEAAERHGAMIAQVENEIAALDQRIAQLREADAEARESARTMAQTRIGRLNDERDTLRTRVDDLAAQIGCLEQDRIAEATGTLRCDGTQAVKGAGDLWVAAGQRLDHLSAEHDKAEARLQAVDDELAVLAAVPDAAGADPAGIERLLSDRAAAIGRRDALADDREAALGRAITADPRHKPMADGLILRGEGVATMRAGSTWLNVRLWLVFLTLSVLDLAALLVIHLQPVPLSLVAREVLDAEIFTGKAIACGAAAITAARIEVLRHQEELASTENQVDERIARHRRSMKTRQEAEPLFDRALRGATQDVHQAARGRHNAA